MINIPHEDMFSLERGNIPRQRLEGEIDLTSNSLVDLKIPDNYEINQINFPNISYEKSIREIIEPISNSCENLGYSHNIFTALYESILNAHQHGNKSNMKKKILFGYKLDPTSIEFIISDEGDKLHKSFLPFILAQRENNFQNSSFIDWYKFSNQEKNQINNGTGTSFIHAYMDEVKYFKSQELNGLAIYLKKYNN